MNETFSIRRFTLLLKKEWVEHRRQYILSVIALFLLINVVLLLQIYSGNNRTYSAENSLSINLFFLFAFGSLYSINAFYKYRAVENAQFHITLPVSTTEKTILELVKTVLISNLTLILLLWATDALYAWMAIHHILPVGYTGSNPDTYREKVVGSLAIFLAVQGWFIYCSLQFRKHAYLIAIITAATVITLLMKFANTIPTFWNISDWGFSHPDFKRTYLEPYTPDGKEPYIENSFLINILRAFYMFAWGPLFYCATYFKLKETQAK